MSTGERRTGTSWSCACEHTLTKEYSASGTPLCGGSLRSFVISMNRTKYGAAFLRSTWRYERARALTRYGWFKGASLSARFPSPIALENDPPKIQTSKRKRSKPALSFRYASLIDSSAYGVRKISAPPAVLVRESMPNNASSPPHNWFSSSSRQCSQRQIASPAHCIAISVCRTIV